MTLGFAGGSYFKGVSVGLLLIVHQFDGKILHHLALVLVIDALVGFVEIPQDPQQNLIWCGRLFNDFLHGRIRSRMVPGDIAGEHETPAIKAIHQPRALI